MFHIQLFGHQWKININIFHFQQFTLGITSLSKVGPIGAAIEVLIIFYLCATSTVGLYTMPFMKTIRPQRHKTSLSQLILNGALVLILSSALPLLSRILGMFRTLYLVLASIFYLFSNFFPSHPHTQESRISICSATLVKSNGWAIFKLFFCTI